MKWRDQSAVLYYEREVKFDRGVPICMRNDAGRRLFCTGTAQRYRLRASQNGPGVISTRYNRVQ